MNFYLHCAEGVYTWLCVCVCVCATFLFNSTISRYTCRRPFQFIHLSHKAKESFNGSPHCGTVEERVLRYHPPNIDLWAFPGWNHLKEPGRAPSQSVEAFSLSSSLMFFPLFPNAFTYAVPLIFALWVPSFLFPFLSLCVCAKMLRKFVSFIK